MTAILDHFGKPIQRPLKDRVELAQIRRAQQGYDSARVTEEYAAHWANADSRDPDSANSREVRHRLIKRSRYEAGSNGFYDGILKTHVNMLVGTGPTLRMLTDNHEFNELVEREFARWAGAVQLRRKLWCMAHARTQDGEAFAVLRTNPRLDSAVLLDVSLIEAEQCQTPYMTMAEGYIDGIRLDEYGNVLWYDILPVHPGSDYGYVNQDPVKVPANSVLHWFKLKRPGAHRGVPDMTSTLNTGASSRRWREATLGAAESAADFNVLLKTAFPPDTMDTVAPMSSLEIQKRMMTALPMGYDAYQMKSEFPTATHESFNRSLISEQARPLSMPYNAAACDSSTYSFASGKLDTLCYRAEINVERKDCDDTTLDPIFREWFKEWTIVEDRRSFTPPHQWDWPAHPVIDAVSEATAEDMRLRNGTKSLRQAYSEAGLDLEDQLKVMAEDYFGDAAKENIDKMRTILLKTYFPEASREALGESVPANQPFPNEEEAA